MELGLAPSACEYIQMDVAINQGNSGGPVVNLAGQVVGISHMKALMSDGVSFAIPIDAAKRVIRQVPAPCRSPALCARVNVLPSARVPGGMLPGTAGALLVCER